MRLVRILLLSVAAITAAARPAAAQIEVSTPGPSATPIEFTYGWDGRFATGPDGALRVTAYPTVKAVAPESPAARAGLRVGDEIISVNGRDGRSPPLFEGVRRGGVRVVLRVRRAEEERDVVFVTRASSS